MCGCPGAPPWSSPRLRNPEPSSQSSAPPGPRPHPVTPRLGGAPLLRAMPHSSALRGPARTHARPPPSPEAREDATCAPRNLTSQALGRAAAPAVPESVRPRREPACPSPAACVRPRHRCACPAISLRVSGRAHPGPWPRPRPKPRPRPTLLSPGPATWDPRGPWGDVRELSAGWRPARPGPALASCRPRLRASSPGS